jgi:hypothetical protein
MSDGDLLFRIVVLAAMVTNLIATLASFRRRPPITEELYKEFALKEELDAAFAKAEKNLTERIVHSDKIHVEIFGIIRTGQAASAQNFQDLERAIGRVEGLVQNINKA